MPKDRPIVFAPDRHLGRWVATQTGRPMVLFPGFCIVHEQFTARRLAGLMAAHPAAKVIVHPECDATVSQMADFVGSTAALIRYVKESPAASFIVGTEAGILHQMRRERPGAELLPIPADSGCNCSLDEGLRQRALLPVQRMLALG